MRMMSFRRMNFRIITLASYGIFVLFSIVIKKTTRILVKPSTLIRTYVGMYVHKYVYVYRDIPQWRKDKRLCKSQQDGVKSCLNHQVVFEVCPLCCIAKGTHSTLNLFYSFVLPQFIGLYMNYAIVHINIHTYIY